MDGQSLQQPHDTHGDAVRELEDGRPHPFVVELRRPAQRQDDGEARQQPAERHVVGPTRQLDGLEAVGQAAVRQQRAPRFRGARADERHLELVGEQPDDVQEDALLPLAADQQGVDLVDDEHARADDPHRVPRHAPGADAAHLAGQRYAERSEQLFVELDLGRLRRQLHHDDRRLRDAEPPVDDPRMLAAELLEDHRLAHAGPAVDEEAGHAVALRVGQQVVHRLQRHLGGRVADPSLGADPLDALVVGQGRQRAMARVEVLVVRHDHSSTG